MQRISGTLFVLMIGFSPLVADDDDDKSRRSIAVTGTVVTKTAPDQIVWSITLVDKGKNLREAKAQNDDKVKAVVALQDTLGLEAGDLETGQIHIHREFERDQFGQTGEFKNFVVNRHVTLRQRDLKKFDEFLEALVMSAEMDVSFQFATSQLHELRAETRLKALKTAQEKAAALAKVVGAKLGQVLTIDEHASDRGRSDHGVSNTLSFHSTPAADLSTKTFVPGAIEVQVTIYATFSLE